MPKELAVSLLFRQQFDAQTDRTFRQTYGLLEYFRNVPQYAPELYGLYKYSRVVSVEYHFEVVNLINRPIEVLGGVLPYDEAQNVSVAQLSEKAGTVRKLISGAGGLDKASITKTCNAQTWFGNPFYTKDYWVTEDQANGTSPLDIFEPVFVFMVQPVLTGSTVNFVVTTKIKYHTQFFDLRVSRQLESEKFDEVTDLQDSVDEQAYARPEISEKSTIAPQKISSRLMKNYNADHVKTTVKCNIH